MKTVKAGYWRHMLRPNVILCAVGIVAGVAGYTAAGRLLNARAMAAESALSARYRPREVVVAARDLAAGQVLAADMLALRQMPSAFLPAGVLTNSQAKAVIGERLAVGLHRGDPLQAELVISRDSQILSNLVRHGGRALTIAVDETNSMAGLLGAGDVVDLYYSRSQGDAATLTPLLEQVEVLAAGVAIEKDRVVARRSPDDARGFSTLTILVSPEDAARVVLAQSTGNVTVLLRSPADESPAVVDTRNSRGLFSRYASKRTDGARSDGIELIVGGGGGVVPEISHINVGYAQSQPARGRT